MLDRFLRIILVVLVMTGAGGRAYASERSVTDYTTTTIISETDGIAPGKTAWFAVQQHVRENWHVFWVNPGDAGIPLNLQWTLPDGFETAAPLHPAPEYIPVGPLASYAHEGEPVFLVSVTASSNVEPGTTIDVVIDAVWQVCEEICIPEDARFEFPLSVVDEMQVRTNVSNLFATARGAFPLIHDGEAVFSRPGGEQFSLRIASWGDVEPQGVFFFPALEGLTTPAAAQTASLENGVLTILMEPGWVNNVDTPTIDGVITFRNGAQEPQSRSITARVEGSLEPALNLPARPVVTTNSKNVIWYLILAFLGGVILNVMPCVFPIIFVKAASFMESAGADQKAIRGHGLLFLAGVLCAFALMGGLLLVLRAGGEQLGWGFHLQSPIVVAMSAYVLFLIGLNLFGVFSIGDRLAGTGDALTRKEGAVGAFFTGALAVVVAAPCIGPLLTAPMGAALMQPAAIGMLIFLLMGLGLATPFLILSFIPSVGRLLPRPGPWMVTMKQLLAFPVFAAAAYFLWVFSQQTGPTGLAHILAGAISLGLGAWLFEFGKGDGRWSFAIRATSALAILLAILPIMRVEPVSATPNSSQGAYGDIATEPFDLARLDTYRAEGTPVFIDFTAAWCVTCQFNKLTVLKSDEVADTFAATGTVLMVADWTVRDPIITKTLESFGASGVPLYVVYPAGQDAQILPPALSREIVIDALQPAT